MMTIKQFASLCGCSTQTLRYYDRIDLLKPVQVDQWSGYRYYERQQAVDFVKIKNLQAADFTIDEIKTLLTVPDRQIHEAFDRKIREQTEKLERIKEIQRSYLTEKNHMEKIVNSLAEYILHAVTDFELLREFGLAPEDGPKVVEQLKAYIARVERRHLDALPEVELTVDGRVFRGEQIPDALSALMGQGYDHEVYIGDEADREEVDPAACEVLWECHGWQCVREFLDRIPPMNQYKDYAFWFRLAEEKQPVGMEFPLFMLAAMLPKVDSDEIRMSCIVNESTDGQNHFALLRTK